MYTIQQISKMAGVSTRTLRYYHQKELLIPTQSTTNKYRLYSDEDINMLQQILFFKELGLTLEEIKKIITNPKFNIEDALLKHKRSLQERKQRINIMIKTINQTLDSINGGYKMNPDKKFYGLKEETLQENEENYGKEIRLKYGEETVEASNQKFMKLSKKDFKDAEELSQLILKTLTEAIKTGNPSSEISQKGCEYHQKWIKYYWPTYSEEAHLGLVEMYTMDERFAKYYAVCGENAAQFLHEAMKIYLS